MGEVYAVKVEYPASERVLITRVNVVGLNGNLSRVFQKLENIRRQITGKYVRVIEEIAGRRVNAWRKPANRLRYGRPPVLEMDLYPPQIIAILADHRLRILSFLRGKKHVGENGRIYFLNQSEVTELVNMVDETNQVVERFNDLLARIVSEWSEIISSFLVSEGVVGYSWKLKTPRLKPVRLYVLPVSPTLPGDVNPLVRVLVSKTMSGLLEVETYG